MNGKFALGSAQIIAVFPNIDSVRISKILEWFSWKKVLPTTKPYHEYEQAKAES